MKRKQVNGDLLLLERMGNSFLIQACEVEIMTEEFLDKIIDSYGSKSMAADELIAKRRFAAQISNDTGAECSVFINEQGLFHVRVTHVASSEPDLHPVTDLDDMLKQISEY